MTSLARESPRVWSDQQALAIEDVSRWIRSRPSARTGNQVYRLFGTAGTGKTTLIREVVAQSGAPWLYAAFTGKAALVMRQKGCHGARTIHSLIYRPFEEPVLSKAKSKAKSKANEETSRPAEVSFRLWQDSPLRDAPGIVVDEASMVDDQLGRDLLSFGKPVLVCGDPGQLPPVEGDSFFMGDPDFMLTEVHRQARESGILDLATFVRDGGEALDWEGDGFSDCRVISRSDLSQLDLWRIVLRADQVIVGRNQTRHEYNAMYRRMLKIQDKFPVPGEKVICLRNDRDAGLLNGSMWRVESSSVSSNQERVSMQIVDDDEMMESPGEVTSWTHGFLGGEPDPRRRMTFQEFAFGYCVTCHKAQGSQWDNVVLFDESFAFRDNSQQWLYTGITRAAKQLTVVVP